MAFALGLMSLGLATPSAATPFRVVVEMTTPAVEPIGSLELTLTFDETVVDPRRRPGDDRELAVENLRSGIISLGALRSDGEAELTFLSPSGIGSAGPLLALEFEMQVPPPVSPGFALSVDTASDLDGVPLGELPSLSLTTESVPEPATFVLLSGIGLAAALGGRRARQRSPRHAAPGSFDAPIRTSSPDRA